MLRGPFPDLRILSHRKRFWLDGKNVVGCNVLLTDRKWGYFRVRSGKDLERCTVIDYDFPVNTFTHRIVDEVRVTDYANLLIGKFCVVLAGRPRRVGWFTLRRRGDRRREK